MDIKSANEKLVKFFLYVTVFFIWFEMVMPSLVFSISFNRIFFIITFVLFLFYVFFNRKNIMLYNKNKLNNIIIIFLLLYIALDIIGLLYSPVFSFAMKQYATLVPVIMLILIGYTTLNNKKDVIHFINTIGISAIAISVYSLFIYFIDSNSKLIYYSRISLVDDYNTFATQILIGTIILLITFGKKVVNDYKLKDFLFFLVIVFTNLPLVILSGSRRSIVVLVVYSLIVIMIFLWNLGRNKGTKKFGLGFAFLIICILAVFLTANLEISLLNNASERNRIRIADPEVASGKYSETDLKDRYDTIASYDGMSKRIYIWKTAINEFKTYNIKEMLIGKGTAYDCYLFYNRGTKGLDRELYARSIKNYPLGSLYSHNIFLTDLLNGGILKLLVQLILFVLILMQIWYVMKKNGTHGTILLLCWGIILSNVLISTKGILYYKPYWIFILINLIIIKNYDKYNISEK